MFPATCWRLTQPLQRTIRWNQDSQRGSIASSCCPDLDVTNGFHIVRTGELVSRGFRGFAHASITGPSEDEAFNAKPLLRQYPAMLGSVDNDSMPGPAARLFVTTHWSLVMAAGNTESPEANEALETLCRIYWYPLYAYVRRKGHSAEDAQDLTQEFFARLLARNYLSVADRNKGKFRSFLLGSLEHFLAREWTKAHAQKRGGGRSNLSLNETDAENRYLIEPSHDWTPKKMFDRRWAITVLDQAMARLRHECMSNRKSDLFNKVECLLSGEKGEASYARIAADLNLSEAALKMAVLRLRRRYGELIRAEIAQTVATPEEAEEELHYLFAVLRD
jgi:RNA polymerase sigma-70 factor (ECF subfamily)